MAIGKSLRTPAIPRGAERICRFAELLDGEGRSFVLSALGRNRTVVLIRKANEIFAYADRCPHMETSLLWDRKVLITSDGNHIRCANHDALFRIRDGLCIAGPCESEHLDALKVKILRGIVWLLPRKL